MHLGDHLPCQNRQITYVFLTTLKTFDDIQFVLSFCDLCATFFFHVTFFFLLSFKSFWYTYFSSFFETVSL